ncbi:hypothetical protein [Comamonas aquatica]|uniref:hypothetical protein n=1 Tax=Comamonas aquatica TaxID=225991 RepID=UPI0028CFF25D|nr:hypothetical protein [Comamonas aquatica]
MQLDFRTCHHCGGYGVRDNGHNCTTCGGVGTGGLLGTGTIGSGELMYDKATGRRVTAAELADYTKAQRATQAAKQGEQP